MNPLSHRRRVEVGAYESVRPWHLVRHTEDDGASAGVRETERTINDAPDCLLVTTGRLLEVEPNRLNVVRSLALFDGKQGRLKLGVRSGSLGHFGSSLTSKGSPKLAAMPDHSGLSLIVWKRISLVRGTTNCVQTP